MEPSLVRPEIATQLHGMILRRTRHTVFQDRRLKAIIPLVVPTQTSRMRPEMPAFGVKSDVAQSWPDID
jgi:hypothetical protein